MGDLVVWGRGADHPAERRPPDASGASIREVEGAEPIIQRSADLQMGAGVLSSSIREVEGAEPIIQRRGERARGVATHLKRVASVFAPESRAAGRHDIEQDMCQDHPRRSNKGDR
jgi:hypothetical protein